MPQSNASDSATSNTLKIVYKPCSGGTCPTVYNDEEGRIFLQGNKVNPEQTEGVAIAPHEGVVELDPSLLEYLRTL